MLQTTESARVNVTAKSRRMAVTFVFSLLLATFQVTLSGAGSAVAAAAVGGSTQMITMSVPSASSTTGTLTAWQKTNGKWAAVIGPVSAKVGAAGVGQASEGSSKTPAGVWSLTQSFGRQSNPGTALSYFRTDGLDWWSSNVNSAGYNTHVRQAANPGGNSENLYSAGAVYDYAVVMDYNTARTPGAGSAFFLHVSDGTPTAGCVATDRATVIRLMQWLDPSQNPVINVGVNVSRPSDDIASLPGHSNPEGAFAATIGQNGRIEVNGWAFDGSNMLAPTDVFFYVNGKSSLYVRADGPRAELATYGILGNHGFVGTFQAVVTGLNQVCMYVRNIGIGSDQLAQCINVNYPANPVRDNPRGALSATVSAAGVITVNGWGFDPNDLLGPVNVMVAVGPKAVVVRADGPRAELAQFGVPGKHGFVISFPAPATGKQDVCLYVANLGFGQSQWVQCLALTYAPDPALVDPRGAFAVAKSNGVLSVNGWAFDPSDFNAPVTTMITVNGDVRTFAAAQSPRPELANFGVPGNHGFVVATAGTSATDEVCLFVFNIGYGSNQLIGCRSI